MATIPILNPELTAYLACAIVLLAFGVLLYGCIYVSGTIAQHEEDTKGWRRS